jgi:aryl-alcohol dehydrogenase-like predicted oxidoreductase
MKYRQLGKNGPTVSAIGYGAMVLSPGIYNPVEEEESLTTFERVFDLGINFVDTADIYGQGHNERLIGGAIRGRRNKVILATKFGGDSDEQGKTVPGMGRSAYISAAIDASLKRLGTDYVDLYYLHRIDPTTPIEETVGAMAELVRVGKVLHLGLSEVSAETILRGHAVHPIAAVQSEYSLFVRDPESTVLPTLKELGIGFVAYSPLGRGILTANITKTEDLAPDDWRHPQPWFQKSNLERNLSLVARLSALAEERGITTTQLALGWLLHQGEHVVPIPGSRRAAHMETNAKAVDLEFQSDELAEVARIVSDGVAGARATPDYLNRVEM